MKKILIATSNQGKFNELLEVLGKLPYQFLSLADLKLTGDLHEHGSTYEMNAILKAEYFGQQAGLPTIADDSGIVVNALKGELGVKTRRWGAGAKATDSEWLSYFLKRMSGEKDRGATFISVIALYRPHQPTITFRGECQGEILTQPQVPLEPGIPLSAVFLPEGKDRVFSAMNKDEKNAISHRGKAIKQCADFLRQTPDSAISI